MSDTGIVYRSKVDWWLAAIVGSAIVVPPVYGLAQLARGSANEEIAVLLLSSSFAFVLILLVGVPIRYTLAEGGLQLRAGVLKKYIPYDRIRAAKPTHNPLASWAWSLDRIELTLDDYSHVLISPVRKEEFLLRLNQRISGSA